MVTTHSPIFVNALAPEEVWILYRSEQGYTQAQRASELRGVKEFVEEGAKLGDLWMEEYFPFDEPEGAGSRVKRADRTTQARLTG